MALRAETQLDGAERIVIGATERRYLGKATKVLKWLMQQDSGLALDEYFDAMSRIDDNGTYTKAGPKPF